MIERTTDGGSAWTRTYFGDATVWSLQWLDASHVFAATDAGLLTTDDGGITWDGPGARAPLVTVHMRSPSSGFAIQGVVRVDQGWLPLNEGVAGRQLLRTEDAGRSWSTVATGLRTVQSIHFVGSSTGWAAGPDGIAVSVDAGRTWKRQFSPPSGTYADDGAAIWSAQVTFTDERHGFALYRTADTSLSKSGKDLYYTEDGGANWVLSSSTVARSWAPDAARNAGGGADGPLIMTGEGSAVWLSASVATPQTFLAVTTDRGRTWTTRRIPFDESGVGDLAVHGTTMWTVLQSGVLGSPSTPSAFLRSLDGGLSWQRLR